MNLYNNFSRLLNLIAYYSHKISKLFYKSNYLYIFPSILGTILILIRLFSYGLFALFLFFLYKASSDYPYIAYFINTISSKVVAFHYIMKIISVSIVNGSVIYLLFYFYNLLFRRHYYKPLPIVCRSAIPTAPVHDTKHC